MYGQRCSSVFAQLPQVSLVDRPRAWLLTLRYMCRTNSFLPIYAVIQMRMAFLQGYYVVTPFIREDG